MMQTKHEDTNSLVIEQSVETTPLINNIEKKKKVELETSVDVENTEVITSLSEEKSADTILQINNVRNERIEEGIVDEEESDGLEMTIEVENASKIYDKLMDILEKFENNTNNSIAWLVPVNTSTSIFPEFVSSTERLSSSAATAIAVSIANSLIAVWENYDEQNKLPQEWCSFKTLVDFIKSPIGAPVCSYTMLLCFKTLGDFAPQLPDNASMLSVIGALFAVSLINGVVTQVGSNSDVNPLSLITRRDVANGMIAGVTAAGFIAQIDRLLKMNMDPTTYQTFGIYMLPVEVAVGLVYGMARIFIPAFIKSQANLTHDEDIALSMMHSIKKNWDDINKHMRFTGNVLYICGLAIESTKLINHNYAAAVITAVTTGPIVATSIDALVSNCSQKQKISSLITGRAVNSPIFRGPINNADESQTQTQDLAIERGSSFI